MKISTLYLCIKFLKEVKNCKMTQEHLQYNMIDLIGLHQLLAFKFSHTKCMKNLML